MTPTIVALVAAVIAGLVSGGIRAWLCRPVVKEARRAVPDYDMSWLRDLPSVAPERDEDEPAVVAVGRHAR